MDFKAAYKALTGKQINQRNKAWSEGWRLNNEGHKLTMENRRTEDSHIGYREMCKDMNWSKKIDWR